VIKKKNTDLLVVVVHYHALQPECLKSFQMAGQLPKEDSQMIYSYKSPHQSCFRSENRQPANQPAQEETNAVEKEGIDTAAKLALFI